MINGHGSALRSEELHRVLAVVPHLYMPCAETAPPCDSAEVVLSHFRPSSTWIDAVVNVVHAVFPGTDGTAYNVLNQSTGVLEHIVSRRRPSTLSPREREHLRINGNASIHGDPAYRRARAAIPSGEVFIDSDFQSRRQLESSRAFREYYRPSGMRFQMVFAIPSDEPDRTTFAAAMRWDRPYSERDRAVGRVLQDHICKAHEAHHARRRAAACKSRIAMESLDPSALESLGLSPRQTEVLYWLACGKRDSEIATILGTSPRTINHHVSAIYQYLGVENRASAIRLSMEAAQNLRD